MNLKRMAISRWIGLGLLLTVVLIMAGMPAAALSGVSYTYTLDADFADGTLINVNYTDVPDQLQLNNQGEPFNFIWVAASARGTIVKIDTTDGTVLGEYHSAPAGMGTNPSRTTVDANGNVWAGNRNEASGGLGSVVHVGLVENGQCEDRDNSGTIETSTGLGDIKPWTNAGGADSNGGVSTAEDECIIHYVRTSGTNVRTVAVDGNNDVWIGGYGNLVHELYDSDGVVVPGTQFYLGCGGYGGLVDANNVLWSASIGYNRLLRYDATAKTGTCIPVNYSYGLGIDTNGNIWNSMYTYNTISKFAPDGTLVTGFPKTTGGASNDRGVAVTPADNNVWVANSGGNNLSRLDNDGNVLQVITVGQAPTGVAVDAAGKVWVTNLSSNNVMRIDPLTNLVDLTVDLGAGAGPYNYSDMTGSTLTAAPDAGTWLVKHDSTLPAAPWSFIGWTADTPGDSTIVVRVRTSDDDVTYSPWFAVTNGVVPAGLPAGQYMEIEVSFARATTGETPILYDLTVSANRAPDCSNATPSIDTIWPPNHKFVPVDVNGITDPDGDALTISVLSIYQDEPLDTYGDGTFIPDGYGLGELTAYVRAERSGTWKVPGDGRVYHITFQATDPYGATCEATLQVGVPHDKHDTPVDGGPLYASTLP